MRAAEAWRRITAGALLAATVLIAGCSSGAQSPSDVTTSAASESPSLVVSPTPEPSAASLFGGSITVTDVDGYTWQLDYNLTSFGPATKSIADDKPGFATLRVASSGTVESTNTTAGRNPPVQFTGGLWVWIEGLYKRSRTVCKVLAEQAEVNMDNNFSGSDDYCAIVVASWDPARLEDTYLKTRPEARIDAAIADIDQGPDFWVVDIAEDTDKFEGGCVLAGSGSHRVIASAPASPC